MSTVAIVSGGLDSVTMAHAAAREHPREPLLLVSFDYRQRHNKELTYAAHCADELDVEHVVLELPHLGGSALTDTARAIPLGHYAHESMRQTVVPNRNMVMLSVAISLAVTHGARRVLTGVHSGDHPIYPDCRPAFIAAMTDTARLANEGFIDPAFTVDAPFSAFTKADIVTLGASLGVPFAATWSCYQGYAVHCGQCGTCTERREAFDVAGVPDPTTYAPAVPVR